MSVRKFSLIIAVMTVLFLLSPAYGEETTGMAVNPVDAKGDPHRLLTDGQITELTPHLAFRQNMPGPAA